MNLDTSIAADPTLLRQHISAIGKLLLKEESEKALDNPTYESGLLGLSLFFCYYARFTGDPEYDEIAGQYLSKAIDVLKVADYKRLYRSDSFDSHLSSIGRFLEFCKKYELIDIDTNEYLEETDHILARLMLTKTSIGDFNLNSGGLASGYYFLSRLGSQPSLAEQLAILVGQIEEKAGVDKEGDLFWKSPSIFNKVYLGISHGSAMIISFLANVYEKNIARDRIRRLLPPAVNFLLKHKTSDPFGFFPLFIDDPEKNRQFSQCYGDLGPGYALLKANRVMNVPAWDAVCREVLDNCLMRRKEDNLTWDASIVYGASGLAAFFEKIYNLIGDIRYKEAAAYWYACIPEYAVHDIGFSGYRTMMGMETKFWNTSFGWGVTGIGISLMRYLDPSLPEIHDLLKFA